MSCACPNTPCNCESAVSDAHPCPDSGNVTNVELLQTCAFLWIVVNRDCQDTPVRVTPKRFAEFVAPLVDIDYQLIQNMIDESIGNIDYSTFATNTSVTNEIATAISNITFPPSGTTQSDVDNAISAAIAGLQYLTPDEIADLLQDYYTRTQVNNLIANVQSQVDTLTSDLAALQAQLDACDCDGSGGNGNPFVAPTASFADILSNNCPATSSSVITSQDDNMTYSITSTGGGVVSVTVDNATETINSFTAPNGSTIVVTVTAADGTNEVGGITINYDDGTNTGILTGFQYDITCPTVVTNPPLTSTNPDPVTTDEGTAATVDISGNVSGGDPLLTPSYTINPSVTGVTVDANGVVSISDTLTNGTYAINVVVTVGAETTNVTITITVDAVAPATSGTTTFGNIVGFADTDDQLNPDTRLYGGLLCGQVPTGDQATYGTCSNTNEFCGIWVTRFMLDLTMSDPKFYIGLATAPINDITLTFPSGGTLVIPAGWIHSASGPDGGIVVDSTIVDDMLNAMQSGTLDVTWDCSGTATQPILAPAECPVNYAFQGGLIGTQQTPTYSFVGGTAPYSIIDSGGTLTGTGVSLVANTDGSFYFEADANLPQNPTSTILAFTTVQVTDADNNTATCSATLGLQGI